MRIAGKQIAAARDLLGLTQAELADAAQVGYHTVRRFEAGEADPRTANLQKIQEELERRGIEFTNGDGPGVRLNLAKAEAYARSQARAAD
jgi:transcriptional regulator with XRE-family HTH domain